MALEKKASQIVILGGGFGGVYTARHLERLLLAYEADITLVSRHNYFLITPLLFETGSGVLEPRHTVNPLRTLFERVRVIQAEVERVDVEAKQVFARPSPGEPITLAYDHLVLALGGVTNRAIVPGSGDAMAFKTLGDAIQLRNHIIGVCEQAEVERDAARRQSLLTIVLVGGGLVALELAGEMTAFLKNLLRSYRNIDPSEVRFEMLEAGPHLAPEFDDKLAAYSADTLTERGVKVRVNTRVEKIDGSEVYLPGGESITSSTIILAAGVSPSPLIGQLPIAKDRKGRAEVEATMRSKSHPEIWALGDCAAIPSPDGKTYPPLAQHALREAKCLANNIKATFGHQELKPFIYHSKGTLAALGHFKGAGMVYGVKIHGLLAWWVWRSYYLFQMPGWSRRLRLVLDWTIALFFRNDIVELDVAKDYGGKR